MEDLYGKITDLENQIFELQQENHLLVTKRIDSNREKDLQIARLEDKLKFASDQADTFAKSLKRVYDLIDELIDEFENADGICLSDLTELKNSIPESALGRAE